MDGSVDGTPPRSKKTPQKVCSHDPHKNYGDSKGPSSISGRRNPIVFLFNF